MVAGPEPPGRRPVRAAPLTVVSRFILVWLLVDPALKALTVQHDIWAKATDIHRRYEGPSRRLIGVGLVRSHLRGRGDYVSDETDSFHCEVMGLRCYRGYMLGFVDYVVDVLYLLDRPVDVARATVAASECITTCFRWWNEYARVQFSGRTLQQICKTHRVSRPEQFWGVFHHHS